MTAFFADSMALWRCRSLAEGSSMMEATLTETVPATRWIRAEVSKRWVDSFMRRRALVWLPRRRAVSARSHSALIAAASGGGVAEEQWG